MTLFQLAPTGDLIRPKNLQAKNGSLFKRIKILMNLVSMDKDSNM